jgi:uncharacterized protein (TIGR02145 family)
MKTKSLYFFSIALSIFIGCNKETDVSPQTTTNNSSTSITDTSTNQIDTTSTATDTSSIDTTSNNQIETSELTDYRDGQTYKIVKIGSQWWMAENLNYYTSLGSWFYSNDSLQYSEKYGRLYKYNAMMNNQSSSSLNPSGIQGISPDGWHIPSILEWEQLEDYLEAANMDARDLKESGTDNWKPTNNGTNNAQFNAVPAGTVYSGGSMSANINGYTNFLSATESTNTNGVLGVGFIYSSRYFHYAPLGKGNGWSIRCVKD